MNPDPELLPEGMLTAPEVGESRALVSEVLAGEEDLFEEFAGEEFREEDR